MLQHVDIENRIEALFGSKRRGRAVSRLAHRWQAAGLSVHLQTGGHGSIRFQRHPVLDERAAEIARDGADTGADL